MLLETREEAWATPPPMEMGAATQQSILVSTAHIHWDPEFCDVKLIQVCIESNTYMFLNKTLLTNMFLRERGMASTPKMEYQVFLCIFQKNSAMATLGLKEMRKFLWEGREKVLPSWLSQFSFSKLRKPVVKQFKIPFPI